MVKKNEEKESVNYCTSFFCFFLKTNRIVYVANSFRIINSMIASSFCFLFKAFYTEEVQFVQSSLRWPYMGVDSEVIPVSSIIYLK